SSTTSRAAPSTPKATRRTRATRSPTKTCPTTRTTTSHSPRRKGGRRRKQARQRSRRWPPMRGIGGAADLVILNHRGHGEHEREGFRRLRLLLLTGRRSRESYRSLQALQRAR